MIFYDPYIYGTNFIAKFRWESGFLKGGSMEPPWALTGVKVPWSLLKVLSEKKKKAKQKTNKNKTKTNTKKTDSVSL